MSLALELPSIYVEKHREVTCVTFLVIRLKCLPNTLVDFAQELSTEKAETRFLSAEWEKIWAKRENSGKNIQFANRTEKK